MLNCILLVIQVLLMNWYISKIVFNISAENTDHKPQFDEQLRLISAGSREEAFLKARALGLREEDSFLNEKNNKVRWEFINVAEILPVDSLKDGMELYSQIHEQDEANSYIQCVHQKAVYLRKQFSELECTASATGQSNLN